MSLVSAIECVQGRDGHGATVWRVVFTAGAQSFDLAGEFESADEAAWMASNFRHALESVGARVPDHFVFSMLGGGK